MASIMRMAHGQERRKPLPCLYDKIVIIIFINTFLFFICNLSYSQSLITPEEIKKFSSEQLYDIYAEQMISMLQNISFKGTQTVSRSLHTDIITKYCTINTLKKLYNQQDMINLFYMPHNMVNYYTYKNKILENYSQACIGDTLTALNCVTNSSTITCKDIHKIKNSYPDEFTCTVDINKNESICYYKNK
jgi:hypothetical protein